MSNVVPEGGTHTAERLPSTASVATRALQLMGPGKPVMFDGVLMNTGGVVSSSSSCRDSFN